MWILPTSSPSAVGGEDLTSASSWLFPLLEQSLMWRSKPMPALSWSRACKRHLWLRLLCGRISKPSTADLGVASWISSLAVTRASRSVSPDDSAVPPIQGTCGLSSEASGRMVNPTSSPSLGSPIASSRTSPTIYEWDSRKSTLTYAAWATELRRVCLLRRKSARLTSESDSSFTPSIWQTPATDSFRSRSGNRKAEMGLDQQARSEQWRTPDAYPRGGAQDADKRKAAGHSVNLQDQTHNWSTLKASDAEKGGPNQSYGSGGTPPLPAQTAQWPTPRAMSFDKSHQPGQTDIDHTARDTMTELWGTPTTRDWKDGDPSPNAPTNSLLSRQAPRSSIGGEPFSHTTLSSHQLSARRQLNPIFVEWLMGWPRGWTVCASSAMELCLWKQRMRTLLSRRLSLDRPSEVVVRGDVPASGGDHRGL